MLQHNSRESAYTDKPVSLAHARGRPPASIRCTENRGLWRRLYPDQDSDPASGFGSSAALGPIWGLRSNIIDGVGAKCCGDAIFLVPRSSGCVDIQVRSSGELFGCLFLRRFPWAISPFFRQNRFERQLAEGACLCGGSRVLCVRRLCDI